MNPNLNKFLTAQASSYTTALSELKNGRKETQWMWYIFPQIKGLGTSTTSIFYSIESLSETKDYLKHEILGKRLKEITEVLLDLEETDPTNIFGYPDDLKLKSCMTLFSIADGKENNPFQKVILKFFEGEFDEKTVEILKEIKS
jgi:uncharacterized protein (DUF1810 family)